MIRSFLNTEISSPVLIQVTGIASTTKRYIRNNPSVGPSADFLPILKKKDGLEREKAFKAFQNVRITPGNKAQFLPSAHLPMPGKERQIEAKGDSNEDQITKAKTDCERARPMTEFESRCKRYKHQSKDEISVRKVCAVMNNYSY